MKHIGPVNFVHVCVQSAHVRNFCNATDQIGQFGPETANLAINKGS